MKIGPILWSFILLLLFQSQVLALIPSPFYRDSQNPQYNTLNPFYSYQNTHLVYVNKQSGIAISQTGKLFFLDTDYSGRIRKIKDQYGKTVYTRDNSPFNNPYRTLAPIQIYDYWNSNTMYNSQNICPFNNH